MTTPYTSVASAHDAATDCVANATNAQVGAQAVADELPTGDTTKLWAKGYTLHPTIERYEAARNAALDAELARHDVWGSLAHARMLHRVGLLTDGEWRALD